MVAANLISDETKERIASGEKLPQGSGYAGCVCGIQINLEKVRFVSFFSTLLFLNEILSKLFAFVEFYTSDDANGAMSLDGISLEGNPLKIRRPKDYVAPPAEPAKEKYIPGIVSTNVADTAYKIFIGGLPSYLNEVCFFSHILSLYLVNIVFSFFFSLGTSERTSLLLWSSPII